MSNTKTHHCVTIVGYLNQFFKKFWLLHPCSNCYSLPWASKTSFKDACHTHAKGRGHSQPPGCKDTQAVEQTTFVEGSWPLTDAPLPTMCMSLLGLRSTSSRPVFRGLRPHDRSCARAACLGRSQISDVQKL